MFMRNSNHTTVTRFYSVECFDTGFQDFENFMVANGQIVFHRWRIGFEIQIPCSTTALAALIVSGPFFVGILDGDFPTTIALPTAKANLRFCSKAALRPMEHPGCPGFGSVLYQDRQPIQKVILDRADADCRVEDLLNDRTIDELGLFDRPGILDIVAWAPHIDGACFEVDDDVGCRIEDPFPNGNEVNVHFTMRHHEVLTLTFVFRWEQIQFVQAHVVGAVEV